MFEDDLPRPPSQIAIGGDLSEASIEELEERIGALKDEIARIETALATKRQGRAAADAVFGGG